MFACRVSSSMLDTGYSALGHTLTEMLLDFWISETCSRALNNAAQIKNWQRCSFLQGDFRNVMMSWTSYGECHETNIMSALDMLISDLRILECMQTDLAPKIKSLSNSCQLSTSLRCAQVDVRVDMMPLQVHCRVSISLGHELRDKVAQNMLRSKFRFLAFRTPVHAEDWHQITSLCAFELGHVMNTMLSAIWNWLRSARRTAVSYLPQD
jgi:hypothetical protein